MESLRAEIDKRTEHPELTRGLRKSYPTLKAAVAAGKETQKSAGSKAGALREQIAGIRDSAKKGKQRQ